MQQPLSQIIELFVAIKRTEGLPRKTTDWRASMLRPFATFLDDPLLGLVTLKDARRFIAYLQHREKRCLYHPGYPRGSARAMEPALLAEPTPSGSQEGGAPGCAEKR